MCNDKVGNFIMVKNSSLLFYMILNDLLIDQVID